MIRVTASLLVRRHDDHPPGSWKRSLAGKTILEHSLAALRGTADIDEIFIITDDPELQSHKTLHGAAINPLAPRLADHSFHFLTHEYWRINYEYEGLQETFPMGDIHFFLGWQTPLLTPRTLERMYHSLMEDSGAARVVPVLPIDPHIYMHLAEPDRYFPVWCAPGLDRQLTPQLFRTVNVCVMHTKRLLEIIPHTKGLEFSREEGLELRRETDFELAEFYFQKRAGASIRLPDGNRP